MLKIKTILLACSLLTLAASCTNDPDLHELTPVEQPFILYADQTVDSLRFFTFDSWTVTPEVGWITIEGDTHQEFTYDFSKRYLCRVFLNLQPNTTGETRSGTVLVQSHDYSYRAPFVQLGMLYLSHPVYAVDSWFDEYGIIPKVAHYELVDSAHWTADSICFTVQDNWTLGFAGEAADWLSFDKTTDLKGKYKVNLSLVPNTTENGREAKLKLTSGDVSNEIIVRQLPAQKEGE